MKALLVDYGGVLTTSVLDSFAAFCAAEQIELDDFRNVVLAAARAPDSPFRRVEVGAITQAVFDDEVASLLTDACGRTIDGTGLKARMFAGVQPDVLMHDALRAARAAGIRTALVSNSWGGNDYPREELGQVFDVMVISGDVGMRKPDAEIYLHAAALTGVEPAECVFIDDFQVNIAGAEAVGMTGVLHRDPRSTIARLEELFGVPLPG